MSVYVCVCVRVCERERERKKERERERGQGTDLRGAALLGERGVESAVGRENVLLPLRPDR